MKTASRKLAVAMACIGLAACATSSNTPTDSPAVSVDSAAAAASTPASSTSLPADSAPRIDSRPFPRDYTIKGTAFEVHQPQYESWREDQLQGRFVMAVKTSAHTGNDGKTEDSYDYGVVQFSARTQVDKTARAVVLTNIEAGPASFPTAVEKQADYLLLAKTRLAQTPTMTVSLDQLESAVSIASVAGQSSESLPVGNTPPEIIFSTAPAMLILLDGEPALRDVDITGVQRVINTQTVLLFSAGRYYTAIVGHWASAPDLDGPWSAAATVPAAVEQAYQQVTETPSAQTRAQAPAEVSQALDGGKIPAIYVRTHPAELISVQGDPQFAAIPGTSLSYITNTGADVFIDGNADQAWYILVSGRWFTAASSQGPWRHVPANRLPADFAEIPAESPKSAVLASIPGTPEARESLIANSVPQTAVVHRSQVSLHVSYDGEPKFEPIDGTTLSYAKNTAVPVIEVAEDSYYAVDKGVWFYAQAATGPWVVAGNVPAVIYTIPTSSPLHYVTYVRVYGSNGDEVYVGYSPGYYGTVVNNGVVVYGTGYACDPWLDTYWYGCPATYGMGVYFGWNPWVGWSFGMGWGWYAGWYGPWGPWWGPWYGPWYPWGWWGGGAAAWNVYGHWGNAAVRGTAAAWANPWTGNVGRGARGGYYNEATGGRGVGRAGINTNVYTGTTVAGAQGIRYNPETGRVVAGSGGAAVNPYTDRAAAGGKRTVVNTDTGRVSQGAGGAVAGEGGAAGGGAFRTEGPGGGSASGIGGFHYNADTGTFHHSGVYNFNDNYYAGRDGNVYHYDNGQWQPVERPDQRSGISGQARRDLPQNLDPDRYARQRGYDRMNGGAQRPHGYNRPPGGYRGGLGGRPMGGFRRR